MEIKESTVKKISFGITDVFLEDYEQGHGKITISNTDRDYNFSYYWGAMGSDLKQFIANTNPDYFASKLCYKRQVFCGKATLKEIRKHIKHEMSWELPWYNHMEFQKDMREKLATLEQEVDNEHHFVSWWNNFVNHQLDYSLINDKYDRNNIEQAFKNISEPWYFIGHTASQEYLWLLDLHKQLKKYFKSKKSN